MERYGLRATVEMLESVQRGGRGVRKRVELHEFVVMHARSSLKSSDLDTHRIDNFG